MAVYITASYDISDPKGYESYVPGVLPLLQKHGAEILVADYAPAPLEGRSAGVNVVLKFDSAWPTGSSRVTHVTETGRQTGTSRQCSGAAYRGSGSVP